MNTCHHLITTVLSWLILSCHLLCHPALGNSDNTTSVKCFDKERKALLQFKDGITKDHCGLLASWRVDSDCCQWHGVHCSNNTDHVTMLCLQGSEFSPCIEGILTPSLCKLEHLRHLDLEFNIFAHPIPDFLGSLANLEYLSLKQNAFVVDSSIPSGNDSYSSHVQNLNWLSHLSLLRYLDLSGNDLSETENTFHIISKLPCLEDLHMDRCQLPVNTPSSPAYKNSSSNLRVISLSENDFNNSSIFQWLSNLPGITTQLVYLDLSWNSLKGPIPNDFGYLHYLSHLDLSDNELEGHLPNNFRNLHHLSYLDLSSNQLQGPFPIMFDNLHHLSYLNLSNSHIPIEFESMDSLSYLSLSYNNFTGEITDVIQILSRSENAPLTTLDLTQNHFWGAIPDSISSLRMLRELYLGGNQISKIGKGIGQLTMLEKLDISSNSLEDTLTDTHFRNLLRLRELYLSDNPRLVIDIDASWVPLFQLDIISLRSCKLGPYFPNWLYMQTNFSYLDVSNAEISGSIHVSFWKSLPLKLQYLNMSCNQFSGLIPFFPNLDYSPDVYLSSNLFEGC